MDEDGIRCSSRAIYSRTLWWHSNRARIDELCICVGNSRVKDVSAGVLIHANVNVTKLLSLWWSKPKQSQRRRSPSCVQKSIGTWLCHWSDDIGAQNSTNVDVPHRDVGKKRRGSTGFVLGKLAGTTVPATTETFGACSLGEHQSIPGAFTLVGQPTMIMKSDDVFREGVRKSYSCLYPQPMWACHRQEQSSNTFHQMLFRLLSHGK